MLYWVGKAQTNVVRDGVLIPDVHDDDFCNSDHIPVYIDLVGGYTWGENNLGGQKIGTGGK